jgi:hypothetical protein
MNQKEFLKQREEWTSPAFEKLMDAIMPAFERLTPEQQEAALRKTDALIERCKNRRRYNSTMKRLGVHKSSTKPKHDRDIHMDKPCSPDCPRCASDRKRAKE